MQPKVYVDINAFRVPEADDDLAQAFRRGSIASLAALAGQTEIVLVADQRAVEEADDLLRLLAREGVEFHTTYSPEKLLDTVRDGKAANAFVFAGPELSPELEQYDGQPVVIDPVADGWARALERFELPDRVATVRRKTSETSIEITVNLDGRGLSEVETGVGFFDHMLEQVARHSRIDISLRAQGDLHIDEHHTIEDVAIVLGEAFRQAVADKRGIERYSFVLPMDEALARVALDLSGRPWLVWEAEFKREKIGDMPTEMVKHFFKSFTDASQSTLNVHCSGENEHHMIESIFKAFGRCLGLSVRRRAGDGLIPSTKGVL
ncbi:MAG: imidazoleglycerol-phosphate dehydratase HisB [Rhodothermia bacterium]|nr:imidazoleglycerol-phosphate dehydratase HisB [Rhodothermia bacterium]